MEVQVKALACELPAEKDLPLSRFSHADIAREAMQRGIVAANSGATVWRWLSADAIKPWHYRSWIFLRDPQFQTKAEVVLDLYQGLYQGQPRGPDDYVISADEKTGLQARKRIAPTEPPGPRSHFIVGYQFFAFYRKMTSMMDARKLLSFRKIGLPIFMALLLLFGLGAAYTVTMVRQARNEAKALQAMSQQLKIMGFVPVQPTTLHLGSVAPQLAWRGDIVNSRCTVCLFKLPVPSTVDRQAIGRICEQVFTEVAAQLPKLEYTPHAIQKAPHLPPLYLYSGVTPHQPGYVLLGAVQRDGKLEALVYYSRGQLSVQDEYYFHYLLASLAQL